MKGREKDAVVRMNPETALMAAEALQNRKKDLLVYAAPVLAPTVDEITKRLEKDCCHVCGYERNLIAVVGGLLCKLCYGVGDGND